MPELTPAPCPNCHAPRTGAYCARCGQAAIRPDDLSARRFFGALWGELTEMDSRSWRTLRALANPGALTLARLAQQRQRYLPPLRLYLIVSGVFFLLAWGVYYEAIEQALLQSASSRPTGFAQVLVEPGAAAAISDWTAVFRFSAVLLFGLGVALTFVRRRLPLGAHMVFAVHYYCADFALFSLFAIPVALAPVEYATLGWQATTMIGVPLLMLYLAIALRRVYRVGKFGAILCALLLMVLDMVLSAVSSNLAIWLVYSLRLAPA